MKRLRIIVMAMVVAVGSLPAAAKDYAFESVAGDPMHTRIYTLDNGLKVYMSVNKEKPRLQTYIAVRTGSRNDPKETTGLAHYLEHLMFKGTRQFGTSDYEAERPLLDSIEQRFETYRTLTDPVQRKAYYHQIDSISQLAAQYNIPNEYDKMMASIGSEGSNAYTSNDQTCYVEDIPSNEVENWARIQADRFQHMVVRGFHTELEAVYEEYNIGLASDARKEWAALEKKLFPTHPYGTQTTIGTQEHLKNPSITNIRNYFGRYYVPNNVAIVLAGDFDPDATIAIIDKYFGSWKPSSSLSRPEYAPVADLRQHADTTVVGLEAENVMMGWKFDKASSLQTDTLELIADVLHNGKAGLFDVDLNQPMKVLQAVAYVNAMTDYTEFILAGMPGKGQSLDEVKRLIIGELDKLKRGDFDDALIPAVAANERLDFFRSLDNNRQRAEIMKDAFINGEEWGQVVTRLDRRASITKQQLADFANRHFADNYACVFKIQDNDTSIHKIDKPQITPIPTNNDKHSAFLEEITHDKPTPIQPVFLDFDKDLTIAKTKNVAKMLYKQNTDNDLFRLSFVFPVGSENSTHLDMAASYLDYVGTPKLSASDIKNAFYRLACDFDVSVGADETRFTLSGLNANMPKALSLLKDYITNAKADTASFGRFVALVEKSREDNKSSQRSNFAALRNYGCYGAYNPTRNVMSERELKSCNPQELLGMLAHLGSYTLLYYGPTPLKNFTKLASQNAFDGKTDARLMEGRRYARETTDAPEVLIAPYDAKNIYMVQYHNENRDWHPENAAVEQLFNEYFGGGMNAIVFQELREARGLAYSASAWYAQPARRTDKECFNTFIITQNDKMMDCVDEFNSLLDSMPERQAAFELARQSLTKSLATARTTKFAILNAYLAAQKLGLGYDLNRTVYEALPKLKLRDIVDFAKQNIAHKPYRYIILGNEKELDMKALEKIGPVRKLTTDEIFGY